MSVRLALEKGGLEDVVTLKIFKSLVHVKEEEALIGDLEGGEASPCPALMPILICTRSENMGVCLCCCT